MSPGRVTSLCSARTCPHLWGEQGIICSSLANANQHPARCKHRPRSCTHGLRATLMESLSDSLGRNAHTSGCWRSFGRVANAAGWLAPAPPLLVHRPVSWYLVHAPDTEYLPTACINGRYQAGVCLIDPSQLLSVPSAPEQHYCSLTGQVGVYQISKIIMRI